MTETAPRRVDAHQHFWDLSVRDQPWTAELPVLRRSFGPDDLLPALREHRVDGTILVQTVTVAEETSEFLALALDHAEVLGVVGWVDLTRPDVADELARLRALPGGERLVGIRHQVQGEPDSRWLMRDDVRRGLTAVGESGLVYELLVTHDQLPAAVEAVASMPDLRWVLDHAGKPPIAAGALNPWRSHISALAAHPGVACKLTGLVTEAGQDWKVDDLRPYTSHVLEAFDPSRVMAGSDWPVCLLRTSYAGVVDLNDALIAELGSAELTEVLGGTAERWYGLISLVE